VAEMSGPYTIHETGTGTFRIENGKGQVCGVFLDRIAAIAAVNKLKLKETSK
jgi:hypothetical protein